MFLVWESVSVLTAVKLGLITTCAVVALIVLVFVAIPAIGGPEPVTSKPTVEQCRELVAGQPRQPRSAQPSWIWGSDAYGWGCRYTYDDGSTATVMVGDR